MSQPNIDKNSSDVSVNKGKSIITNYITVTKKGADGAPAPVGSEAMGPPVIAKTLEVNADGSPMAQDIVGDGSVIFVTENQSDNLNKESQDNPNNENTSVLNLGSKSELLTINTGGNIGKSTLDNPGLETLRKAMPMVPPGMQLIKKVPNPFEKTASAVSSQGTARSNRMSKLVTPAEVTPRSCNLSGGTAKESYNDSNINNFDAPNQPDFAEKAGPSYSDAASQFRVFICAEKGEEVHKSEADAIKTALETHLFKQILEVPAGTFNPPNFGWMGWQRSGFKVTCKDELAVAWLKSKVPTFTKGKYTALTEEEKNNLLIYSCSIPSSMLKTLGSLEEVMKMITHQNGIPGRFELVKSHPSKDGLGHVLIIQLEESSVDYLTSNCGMVPKLGYHGLQLTPAGQYQRKDVTQKVQTIKKDNKNIKNPLYKKSVTQVTQEKPSGKVTQEKPGTKVTLKKPGQTSSTKVTQKEKPKVTQKPEKPKVTQKVGIPKSKTDTVTKEKPASIPNANNAKNPKLPPGMTMEQFIAKKKAKGLIQRRKLRAKKRARAAAAKLAAAEQATPKDTINQNQ